MDACFLYAGILAGNSICKLFCKAGRIRFFGIQQLFFKTICRNEYFIRRIFFLFTSGAVTSFFAAGRFCFYKNEKISLFSGSGLDGLFRGGRVDNGGAAYGYQRDFALCCRNVPSFFVLCSGLYGGVDDMQAISAESMESSESGFYRCSHVCRDVIRDIHKSGLSESVYTNTSVKVCKIKKVARAQSFLFYRETVLRQKTESI